MPRRLRRLGRLHQPVDHEPVTGLHSFAVRATDAAGNTDATPATQTFRSPPTTPPTTTTRRR